MSWLVGALQLGGALVDAAGSVSNMVYQHKQLELLKQQNQLYSTWMAKNEQLQRDSMALSEKLSTEGPALRVKAALDAGFDPVSARRLAGSGERRIQGYIDMPVMTQQQSSAHWVNGNLAKVNSALTTFQQGTPFGKPQPPKFQTGGPNIGNNRPTVNIGHNPGSSSA
uniref:ORF2 protein n=2 Tax=Sapovirus GIV TaxID=515179 RepID=A0A3G1QS57_9CALI|nr:ORF2 protein [Sapovirus GIV]AWK57677.1 ORF2 protein [Sapovirus GIV.1]AWK57681.1 ORF2 protein [Sapovirus GIV.1]